MRLSSKLSLTVLAAITGLLVVSGEGVYELRQIRMVADGMLSRSMPDRYTYERIRLEMSQVKSNMLLLADADSPTLAGRINDQIGALETQLDTELDEYGHNAITDSKSRWLVDDFVESAHAALGNFRSLRMLSHIDTAGAKSQVSAATNFYTKYEMAANALSAYEREASLVNGETFESVWRRAVWLCMGTAATFILLLAELGIWAYRSLIKPLRALELKLATMSETLDLRQQVNLGSSEELQRASVALNRLLERTRGGMLEMKAKNAAATYSANHDSLTGLPNRRYVDELLRAAVTQSVSKKLKVGLLYLDLDGFKKVNDQHGHDAGDYVLRTVGDRVLSAIRQGDTVARLGGDEFLVILGCIDAPANAAVVAQKIISSVRAPMPFKGVNLEIGVSVGISISPDHGDDVEILKRAADSAMYEVKKAGKNGFAVAAVPA